MVELTPWREQEEFDRFRNEIDRLFDRLLNVRFPRLSPTPNRWTPAVDLSETAEDIVVRVEVPGVEPNDIHASVTGRVLEIHGERKRDFDETTEKPHRTEGSYGVFSREVRLPADVDSEKVRATCRNGIVKLVLPKSKDQSSKKIDIQTLS
jgi:HSP20 family protein